MKISENVRQIKIDFNVTPEIARYVYVYLIEGQTGCWLIDSGVAGAWKEIFSYMENIGRKPLDIRTLFLTHSHPDHIGSAKAIRDAAGCEIFGPERERGWIEDIGQQFEERPIPNFYQLAGESVGLDRGLKGQDRLCLEEGLTLSVVETGGHSHGSISYLLEEKGVLFTGDAIPVAGDIPIYVSLNESAASLERMRRLWPVDICCPAWDTVYRGEVGLQKIDGALELLGRIKESVAWAKGKAGCAAWMEGQEGGVSGAEGQEGGISRAEGQEGGISGAEGQEGGISRAEEQESPKDWQGLACRRLGLDHLAGNPLFRTSLQCTETERV